MGFPLRAAALDVGSNAIRYQLVEFSDPEHFVELDSQRLPVRLGHDAFTSGRLRKETLAAAAAVAVEFRQRLDALGVEHYRAVATSAVRESKNGSALVDRVRRESGVLLETITGTEEARLVWLAVRQRFSLNDRAWLLADLGGGSIEMSVIDESGIRWSESHPMGTVRLLEDLGGGAEAAPDFQELVEHYTSRLELPADAADSLEGIIITGGNADALADLVPAPPNAVGASEMTRAELQAVLQRLAGMSFQERVDRLGLRPDRADVIVPAAIIFDRVAELAASERIVVPRVGVKEGVLYDIAADVAGHRAHATELERVTLAGALALGRHYQFDEAHARHVADLALSLFDQLRPLHDLEEASKSRLTAAALLHDVGQFVSYRRHHKHSWYLISHSELAGLSPQDIRLVALLTRYHRRSEPKDYHEGYADLNEREKLEVRKLAAILRVADALDREHQGRVRRIDVRSGKGAVVLELQGTGSTVLEEWALKKKAGLFEKVFKVELRLSSP